MTRHEFLTALHQMLQPKVYLEIGVQHGTSLRLAGPDTWAMGIDPNPLYEPPVASYQQVLRMTSDEFFARADALIAEGTPAPAPVDLGFIDGMHLVEYALRDFIGLERLSSPTGVIVFDDVLPTTQAMAARDQCPGDWTGDIWRIDEILTKYRLDLDLWLVDTFPTGLLVATNLDPTNRRLTDHADNIATRWPPEDTTVPGAVIDRLHAWAPAAALKAISDWWRTVSRTQPTTEEIPT